MVEIKKNGCKISIFPFEDCSPTVEILQFSKQPFVDKISNLDFFQLNSVKNFLQFAKNITKQGKKESIYIGCFYLVVDNEKESNAFCVQNKKITIFGESFVDKNINILLGEESFSIFVGIDNFFKSNSNAIFLCNNLKEDDDKNVYYFSDKTRIYIYKNDLIQNITL